eukprot:scaffold2214_cov139-Cylindrotheca_fusiformis.AAC.33
MRMNRRGTVQPSPSTRIHRGCPRQGRKELYRDEKESRLPATSVVEEVLGQHHFEHAFVPLRFSFTRRRRMDDHCIPLFEYAVLAFSAKRSVFSRGRQSCRVAMDEQQLSIGRMVAIKAL